MAKIVSKSRSEPGKSPAAAAHRPVGEAHRTIHVRGAREHNLKNVDLEIPRDALIVFTGLSGSGKSSLAFDTIYAEGQRRYVESLSAYARQFLEMMQKPDVDHIDGLSPAISIEQKTTSKNPRSTVGTVTEIYDYLRLLFARVGVPYSPATGLPIESQTVTQMVDRVLGRSIALTPPATKISTDRAFSAGPARPCSLHCRSNSFGLGHRREMAPGPEMPTVLRVGPYRFFFYSGDGSRAGACSRRSGTTAWPSSGFIPVRLSRSGGFGRTELREIDRLVQEHAQQLLEDWNDYFGH